jgi:hypothetical protein
MGYGLRVTGYGLRVASCGLRVAGCGLRVRRRRPIAGSTRNPQLVTCNPQPLLLRRPATIDQDIRPSDETGGVRA